MFSSLAFFFFLLETHEGKLVNVSGMDGRHQALELIVRGAHSFMFMGILDEVERLVWLNLQQPTALP